MAMLLAASTAQAARVELHRETALWVRAADDAQLTIPGSSRFQLWSVVPQHANGYGFVFVPNAQRMRHSETLRRFAERLADEGYAVVTLSPLAELGMLSAGWRHSVLSSRVRVALEFLAADGVGSVAVVLPANEWTVPIERLVPIGGEPVIRGIIVEGAVAARLANAAIDGGLRLLEITVGQWPTSSPLAADPMRVARHRHHRWIHLSAFSSPRRPGYQAAWERAVIGWMRRTRTEWPAWSFARTDEAPDAASAAVEPGPSNPESRPPGSSPSASSPPESRISGQ
ncbi:MAG: hypothetical protein AAF493_06670 [Pseudomonadota bacterium]